MLRFLTKGHSAPQPTAIAASRSASSLAASSSGRTTSAIASPAGLTTAMTVLEAAPQPLLIKRVVTQSTGVRHSLSSLVHPRLSYAPVSPFSAVAEVAYPRTLLPASIFSRSISTGKEAETVFDEVKISELLDKLNAQDLIHHFYSDTAISNEQLNSAIQLLPSVIALSLELYSLKNHYISFNDKLSLKLQIIVTRTMLNDQYKTLCDMHPDSSSDYKNIMYCLLNCQSAIVYYTKKSEDTAGIDWSDMSDCLKEANLISFLINDENNSTNEITLPVVSSHSGSSSTLFSNKQSYQFLPKLGLGIFSLLVTGYIIHTLLARDDNALMAIDNKDNKDNKDKNDAGKNNEALQVKTEGAKLVLTPAQQALLADHDHVDVFDEAKINRLVDKLKDIDVYHLNDLEAEEINLAMREVPSIIKLLSELFGVKHYQIVFNPELSSKLQAYVDRSITNSQHKLINDVYTGASKDYRNLMQFLLTYQTELCDYSESIGHITGAKGWTYMDYFEKSKSITFVVKNQRANSNLSTDTDTRAMSRMRSGR